MSLPLRPYDRQLLKVSVDATGVPYFRGDTGQGRLTVLILYGLYTEEGTLSSKRDNSRKGPQILKCPPTNAV